MPRVDALELMLAIDLELLLGQARLPQLLATLREGIRHGRMVLVEVLEELLLLLEEDASLALLLAFLDLLLAHLQTRTAAVSTLRMPPEASQRTVW